MLLSFLSVLWIFFAFPTNFSYALFRSISTRCKYAKCMCVHCIVHSAHCTQHSVGSGRTDREGRKWEFHPTKLFFYVGKAADTNSIGVALDFLVHSARTNNRNCTGETETLVRQPISGAELSSSVNCTAPNQSPIINLLVSIIILILI